VAEAQPNVVHFSFTKRHLVPTISLIFAEMKLKHLLHSFSTVFRQIGNMHSFILSITMMITVCFLKKTSKALFPKLIQACCGPTWRIEGLA